MNGTQVRANRVTSETCHLEVATAGSQKSPATGFMHPDDVVSNLRLTNTEKREILASWASDVSAVPDAPALRQLDNGAVVHVDDILQALSVLDEAEASAPAAFNSYWSYAGLRISLPRRLKLPWRRDWPDDDDPPPCPAMASRPPRGPRPHEAAAELALSSAA